MRHLLLLSSSKAGSGGYLEQAIPQIQQFLPKEIKQLLFIPFAAVTTDYDDYTQKVTDALSPLDINVIPLHRQEDPNQAIREAQAIVIGGGNTFHLLHQLYQFDLIGIIRDKVLSGTPYIGWSAGSNIASPTIKTTNDMPIVQPPSFHALHLIPFQINPHFLDQLPAHFNGETRSQRLQEFMQVNPDSHTLGLPEGTAVQITNNQLTLIGSADIYLFSNGEKEIIDPSNPPECLQIYDH